MAIQRAVCIVRDEALSKKEFVVEPSLPVIDFRKMVAENFEQEVEELDLFLQNSLCSLTVIDHTKDTLCDTGIIFDPDVRNNIMIMAKKKPVRTRKTYDFMGDIAEANKDDISSPSFTRSRLSALRSEEYIGLKNANNDCYLNCVLQLLYMTPEFRNAVYEWIIKDNNNNEDNILIELQRLFAFLKLSSNNALPTTKFVKSFTWSQSRDQQDISEFITLLFSSIRKSLERQKINDVIKNLYEGSIINYIKCLGCDKESVYKGEFIDVQLALKNNDDDTFKSIEEAIDWFLLPEELTGNNQYHCSSCDNKCNAKKGQKFAVLPYIVHFFLTRLSFDRSSGQLIKINDKVEYPQILKLSDEQGEYEYELFGVILHTGTAYTGHYFSYLKNLNYQAWYSFNDQRVMTITEDDVIRGFGGENPTTRIMRSSNAYMLSYRRIDGERNQRYMELADFSDDNKNVVIDYLRAENELIMILQVYFEKDGETISKQFYINSDRTIEYAKDYFYHYFIGKVDNNADEYRLVLYDPVEKKIIKALEDKTASLYDLDKRNNLFLEKVPVENMPKRYERLKKYNFESLDQIYVPTVTTITKPRLPEPEPEVISIEESDDERNSDIIEETDNFYILVKPMENLFIIYIHSFSTNFKLIGGADSKTSLLAIANFSFYQGLNVMLLDKDILKINHSDMYKALLRTENLKIIKKAFASKDVTKNYLPFYYHLRKPIKKLYFTLKTVRVTHQKYSLSIGFLDKI